MSRGDFGCLLSCSSEFVLSRFLIGSAGTGGTVCGEVSCDVLFIEDDRRLVKDLDRSADAGRGASAGIAESLASSKLSYSRALLASPSVLLYA